MRVVVQRSQQASCTVGGVITGEIDYGLVLLVGFTKGDNQETLEKMAKKVIGLRIFDDSEGVMNQSILDVGGKILSISQFTLYANTTKGCRPSYQEALPSLEASLLYDLWNDILREFVPVEIGAFGKAMKIQLINDGPVTILLER